MTASKRRVWTEAEIALRNLSAPIRDVMKFHLVYHGPLVASANKPKTADVTKLREAFSPQLEHLWKTNHALQVLAEEAWVAVKMRGTNLMTNFGAPTPRQRAQMLPGTMLDLCAPIPVEAKTYKPLVRGSLHLNCELSILFLRQEDPGLLISQGGDLDGRIKTLLDALRMPSVQEQTVAPPTSDNLFCLMESDTLVAALDIDTDRLLFPQTTFPNEVHLVIEVSLRVLRIAPYNTCLL